MTAIVARAASALLLAGCAILMPVSQPAAKPAPARGPSLAIPAGESPEVRRLVELVNRHRISIGLAPLAWSRRLAHVAMAHSVDMSRRKFFSHENPDGKSPFDRMHAAGIEFHAAGENLAAGQTTADIAFESWMRSSGHRANIENEIYRYQGIAVYRNHWTHLFLTP